LKACPRQTSFSIPSRRIAFWQAFASSWLLLLALLLLMVRVLLLLVLAAAVLPPLLLLLLLLLLSVSEELVGQLHTMKDSMQQLKKHCVCLCRLRQICYTCQHGLKARNVVGRPCWQQELV